MASTGAQFRFERSGPAAQPQARHHAGAAVLPRPSRNAHSPTNDPTSAPPAAARTIPFITALRSPQSPRKPKLDNFADEIWKSADLILARGDALNLAPIGDPVGALVLGGHAGNIEAVFVEGTAVMWGGKIPAADTSKAVTLAERSREYLCEAVAKSAGA